MFGKKKAAAAPIVDREKALALIEQELKEMEDVQDGAFMRAFICGMARMAFNLNAINCNEHASITERAHKLEKAIKARGKPVYKKTGVYEYRGYNILKDKAKYKGDGSSCWYIKEINKEDTLKADITFTEAIREIDKYNDKQE